MRVAIITDMEGISGIVRWEQVVPASPLAEPVVQRNARRGDGGRAARRHRHRSVKTGLGRSSAVLVPPVRAREMIRAGAKDAMARIGSVKPYDPGKPCEIVVEFMNTAAWEEFRHRHGVEDAGERKIRATAPDWWTAWTTFLERAVYTPSFRV